jgi:hypothetical protein
VHFGGAGRLVDIGDHAHASPRLWP